MLSRNPFSRFGCHPHIKSPTSGPHWAIMGIVVFFGVVLGFLGPGESVGGHFLRSPSPFVHMLEQRERRRSHRDCGPSVVVRDRTSSCRAQCRASYVDVRPCATGAHRPSSPAAAASKLDLQLRKCISLSLSLVWKLQI